MRSNYQLMMLGKKQTVMKGEEERGQVWWGSGKRCNNIDPQVQNSYGLSNLLQLFHMRLLKHHEIAQAELNLLQTCGHSLADHAHSQPSQQIPKIQNLPLLKSIGKLQIKWVKNVERDPNSNLKAFVLVLLHRIYSVSIEQRLLAFVKSSFYSCELSLPAGEVAFLPGLSSNQMKKLVVQFFHLLSYSFFDDKIEAKLNKYPVIMSIFVLFLRKVLTHLQCDGTLQLADPLPASKIYPLLAAYFGLRLQTPENAYVFPEAQVMVLAEPEFCVAGYAEEGAASAKLSDSSNISVKEASSTSQKGLSNQSNASCKTFFPKKCMNIMNQQKPTTIPNLNHVNQTAIKKTKSQKDCRRKYSNTQQAYQVKATSAFNQTQASNKDGCECIEKKQAKMALSSNQYELNIMFLESSGQRQCFVSSKGFNCELYDTRKEGKHFLKRYFEQKKAQASSSHSQTLLSDKKEKFAALKGPNQAFNEKHYRLTSKYTQSQLHFQPKKPCLLQSKSSVSPIQALKSSPTLPFKPSYTDFGPSSKYRKSTVNLSSSERFL